MTDFQLAYVPIGVPTFHLESAQKEFEKKKRKFLQEVKMNLKNQLHY